MRGAWFAAVCTLACQSSVTTEEQASAGASASGAGGNGSSVTSVTSVAAAGGGSSVSTGVGGADPAPSTCAGLDYCGCVSNAACTVIAEDCFCPCGVEPCEPDCECDCSGGNYLGCAPTSIWNPGALEGIWLIGWSGGAHHFSWVRIEPDGKLTVNDGAALASNLPYYPCNGVGEWILTAKPETLGLYLPGDCGFTSLTFAEWLGTPSFPYGCLQEVRLEDNLQGTEIMGCRFPLDQCDAAMTACIDPLAP